jgi:radical SAM protein with 4Fe4S-binding SPASM domain
MEFFKTQKLLDGKYDKPIIFEELKKLEKIMVNQKLELINDEKNISLLKEYADKGYKIVPIRRMSKRNWAERKDFPNRVLLEMTSRCNVHCRMCPRHDLKRSLIDFDKDLYLKVVDELNEHGIEGLWLFHLGEPILHPDWKEILEYVGKKENIEYTWFSTNGVAFDSECIDFILNSNLSFLNYSLHGTNEETYSYVNNKEKYKDVRLHLDELVFKKKKLGKGPILHIQMIDQEGTKSNINEFLETFYDTGEVVSINTLEYANLPNNEYGLKRERPPVVKKCKRISRGDCFIVSNGDIQPCDATYNSEILLGNVKNDSVYNIWNSETRKHMLELNEKECLYEIEHCKKCTDYDL